MAIKIKKIIIPFCAVILSLYCMFKMPESVAEGITDGFKICFYTLLPSLFPFMILSSYIIKSDVLYPVYRFLSPVTRTLFKQPPSAAAVIIMSLIGGFPIGAKMTYSLYKSGKISENEAKRLNCFTVNAGPAFAVTAVGVSMFRSTRAGLIIYVSLCLSSILSGIITSFFAVEEPRKKKEIYEIGSPMSSLSAAVGDSVTGMLGICGWVVLFAAAAACLKEAFPRTHCIAPLFPSLR